MHGEHVQIVDSKNHRARVSSKVENRVIRVEMKEVFSGWNGEVPMAFCSTARANLHILGEQGAADADALLI